MSLTPAIWHQPPEPPGGPTLPADEVHVWRGSLDQPQDRLQIWWETLAEDEKKRAESFHFERDRKHFIAGRGMLRQIAGRYLKAAPDSLRFDYTYYGKPSLTSDNGDAELRFNLSHSGELALYAFSRRRELGVDIEKTRPDIEHSQIAGRFFSKHEVAALSALPAQLQPQAFFLCWTRKEAYIKGIGEGLSLPLHSFDVSLAPGEPAALLAVRGDKQESRRWSLRALQPGPEYEAALVAEGSEWQLKCWQWND